MSFLSYRFVAVAMAFLVTCALPAAAHAAPANDNIADAIALTGAAGTVYGSTYGATSEPNEDCRWGCGASVWYSFTPSSSSSVNFNTCQGTNYDSTLSIYQGTAGSLSLIAANDDACSWLSSSVSVSVTSGTRYLIRVGGYYTSQGNFGMAYPSGGVGSHDTTAPVISVPSNVTAEATSGAGATVTFSASAVDAVDGVRSVNCVPASGSVFPVATTAVACSSSDVAGNTGTASFTVTVQDTTAPTLTVPADQTAIATSTAGAAVDYPAATATDLVDGDVTPSCSPASGSTFALGTTTVTCTATDAAGNASSGSFTVNVSYEWSGVLSPVNADGTSVFRFGSTVPVKFRLAGASAGIVDATARIYLSRLSGSVQGTELEAASTSQATTGNLFRYTDGQYAFNLTTKTLEAGTWRLRIDLGDGVAHSVNISLR